jgi:hypothetical protein
MRLRVIPCRPALIWPTLALLLFLSGPVRAFDLAECRDQVGPGDAGLRCLLWDLAAWTQAANGDDDERTTGRVQLGERLWGEARFDVGALEAAWPVRVRLTVHKGAGEGDPAIAQWTDHGLDGLQPDDQDDVFPSPDASPPLPAFAGSPAAGSDAEPNRVYRAWIEALSRSLEKQPVHGPVDWTQEAPGLEYGRFTAFRYIRLGMNLIHLVRFDPARFGLEPLSLQNSEENDRVLGISEWARHAPQAAALFNSGQYYSDYRYIGLLIKDGAHLGTGLHPKWKGLLLSGGPRAAGVPSTTIHDLDEAPFDPNRTPYRHVVQSYMLLGRDGRPRVRRSDNQASRTVVAQDRRGRIVVVMVPGAATLHELALLLRQSGLEIEKAIGLDGGFEAQLLFRSSSGILAYHGSWAVTRDRRYHQEGLALALPSVLAVVPLSP